jgi:hypothetical protein
MSAWTNLGENGVHVEGDTWALPCWEEYGICCHTLGGMCMVQKFTVLTDSWECDSMIMEVETMYNLMGFLEKLPSRYYAPLSDRELRRLARRWEGYAREAGMLGNYRAAGGFDWVEVSSSLSFPWSRYPEAWARLLLEDDVAAIVTARMMWGLPIFR